MADYEFIYEPVSSIVACSEKIEHESSSTGGYPDVSGNFSVSDGIVIDGGSLSLASPVSSFTLSTESSLTLPSVGKYIKVKGIIYQVTADSEVEVTYWTEGGYSSTLYTATSIHIYNVNKVIVSIADPEEISQHITLIENVGRAIGSGKSLVNGVGYDIEKGRTLNDGIGYDIVVTPTVKDLGIGDSVFFNVDGVRQELLIVHQGNPDTSMYDSSCDGVWVVMKNTLPQAKYWYYTTIVKERAEYYSSEIHEYLTDTFPSLIDSFVSSKIKTVKIPYMREGYFKSGANGLSTKFFVLSGSELGWTSSNSNDCYTDGARLQYFVGAESTDARRIAYDPTSGEATYYWTRSPRARYKTDVMGEARRVTPTGYYSHLEMNSKSRIRPAFILDYDTVIDSDTHDIIE